MVSIEKQHEFITITNSKFTDKELDWINAKSAIVASAETSKKFNVFFSLAVRFISADIPSWSIKEIEALEGIYPGFNKSIWTKQDIARARLMIALNKSTNESVLISFFEIAEMKEQVALYKGLYLLENSSKFTAQVAEGIRTNMANVFDAIASGNPFPYTYLDEDAWNQLVLKSFFMERNLFPVQFIDQGKNENLANMLQDYVKERWAANRQISPEVWRMINGYLRDDVKNILLERNFEGNEKKAIDRVLSNTTDIDNDFWDSIGKSN